MAGSTNTIKKIPYDAFTNESTPLLHKTEEEIALDVFRHNNSSFIDYMSDVWGEASQCVALKSSDNNTALDSHIMTFIRIVDSVLTDDKISDGAKRELKEAEWELLDYCIWDNEWNNTDKSVMSWFDQWVFDYNYDNILYHP